MTRNLALYPWLKLCQNLAFWQATWFLYFQQELSASQAILLYVIYDIATTVLEVPSGYMSDRLGRRLTLICAAIALFAGAALITVGNSFAIFAGGQILLGAASAFRSGTDTSLLYESLTAEGRSDEVETHELRAWRFGFSALALSAVTGGALALWSGALPFAAGAIAAAVLLAVTLQLKEPPHKLRAPERFDDLRTLRANFANPTLLWLFALSLLMYVFSHIPFVFGQPFIAEAMATSGLRSEAPLVSGTVSAAMMVLSVLVSLVALRIRKRIGLPAILLVAFAMQIALVASLALSGSVLVIGLLLFRMIPNSLSQPFIQARIQPLLEDGTRATYLSLQSLTGRLVFAATLLLASGSASTSANLSFDQIHTIAGWYALAGLAALTTLAFTARRANLE
ncbi:putative MFS family arabinose efflux permease [Litoreibacter meonggei]|uniref:Putative MFS family arabinose efflux permease n=1 Tax=Litoreibacter meonggei TaxID=1049199 RepID=A0A497VDT2_9RHOB|nr:MFS transporter [Litoreibacter meonggei]RLJ36329.1 putative MFS family arabinose efflux permease [Litoreibacter meonggei]